MFYAEMWAQVKLDHAMKLKLSMVLFVLIALDVSSASPLGALVSHVLRIGATMLFIF